jgi:uncharacterized protein
VSSPALIVLAKEPVAGRVKTRLCPPCSPVQAAHLARVALTQTLRAVAEVSVGRRVLALDGEPGPWLPLGFEVIRQRGFGLDQRLAAAFEDSQGPAFLIGMDTPQVNPLLLTVALSRLVSPGVDALLGRAMDGGWWGIGLRRPEPKVFLGVPMSTPYTADEQALRLTAIGLRWEGLPPLRDVDRFEDALAVADEMPGSPFSRAVRRVAGAMVRPGAVMGR